MGNEYRNEKDQKKESFGDLNKSITIFATNKGVNVVKSPVKSNILQALKKKELNFDEIVKVAGRSRSTVSVHLKELREQGILESRTNNHDKRKKIFFLNSRYIGEMNPNAIAEMEEGNLEFLIEHLINQGNPYEFFRLMFHILRVEMIKEGINLDPLLQQTGKKIGQVFFPELQNKNTEKFLEKLVKFWEANALGKLEVRSIKPIIIQAYDCFECEFLPNIGKSACALDSGILEALFSSHFSQEVTVDEIKCYARGDQYCCFILKLKNSKD
ncbi:MAG: ArsR family transcriptional regulator [Methanobacteriaceae archaeon]|nr:ArsR family transcriptional regulator [Methanobacteriaceae archaeon]